MITRRQWGYALASVLLTAIVMVAFLVESRWGYLPPPPKIVYFQSWPASDVSPAAVLAEPPASTDAPAEPDR